MKRQPTIPTIPTYGEVFPDGTILELLRPDPHGERLALLRQEGAKRIAGWQAKHHGRTYVPGALDSSILDAVHLPAGVSDYGTTKDLFDKILGTFATHADSSERTS